MTADPTDSEDGAGSDGLVVRQARADDHADVAGFTSDTWGERHGDYVPDVFEEWVATDGPDQRTFVLADGDEAVGLLQGVMLSEYEAWAQGMRVAPSHRGRGASPRLSHALFDWARDRGATVVRNMVFSWNVAGLGQSRAVGFEPCTEFRYALPDPDPDADPDLEARTGDADPDAAWTFWTGSAFRDRLRGLAMDDAESWALSELTRERLRTAADDGRLVTVRDGGLRGFTYRDRTYERETDDGVETRALYGVAAWDDPDAAAALYDAVARDAAAVGADAVRVLIPEGVGPVSDTAAARVAVADEPDFVTAADLTDPGLGREGGR